VREGLIRGACCFGCLRGVSIQTVKWNFPTNTGLVFSYLVRNLARDVFDV